MHFITFLRHGESEGNITGILQGQSDPPLTLTGIEQAERLASYWKSNQVNFNLVITSPLQRATKTAEIIANSLQIPVEFDPAWMERNFGHLQGLDLQELDRRKPPVDYFHPYEPIGDSGESQLELYARASLALQKIIRNPPGSYLVVSHGGILNKALYAILGITPQGHYNSPIFYFGNTSYAQCRYNSTSRQWAVIGLNCRFVDDQSEGLIDWQLD